MIYIDILIFLAGWLLGQIVFAGYEAHVSPVKRFVKLIVLCAVFFSVHVFLGRWFFYGLLGVMATGMGILHGYWFHKKHGIHWRTAEPRDKYLALIGKTPRDTKTD